MNLLPEYHLKFTLDFCKYTQETMDTELLVLTRRRYSFPSWLRHYTYHQLIDRCMPSRRRDYGGDEMSSIIVGLYPESSSLNPNEFYTTFRNHLNGDFSIFSYFDVHQVNKLNNEYTNFLSYSTGSSTPIDFETALILGEHYFNNTATTFPFSNRILFIPDYFLLKNNETSNYNAIRFLDSLTRWCFVNDYVLLLLQSSSLLVYHSGGCHEFKINSSI